MLNSSRFRTKPRLKLSIAIIVVSFIVATLAVQAAVELKYFRAEQQSDNTLLLKWETATELDHAAFFLSRAESADGDYQELGSFPAEGDSVSGAIYEYVDADLQEGIAYYYKLEDMDTSGNIALAHPVIFSGINVDTATPTPAPTDTPEPTDTPTTTPINTPTHTPQPTNTPIHTPTAAPTTASTATFTPVSTATLVPTNTPATISTNTPASTATSVPGASPTSPSATVEPTHTPSGSTPVADTPIPATTPAKTGDSTPIPALTLTPTPMPPAPTTAGQAPPPTTDFVTFPTPMPEVEESSGSEIQNILLGIGLVALLAAAGLAFYAVRMWRQPPEDQA